MDELLDLVNENDEVVGEVWKSLANSDPSKIHREILIYIFDDQKRMLVQQRSFKKKIYPGAWAESCSGHVAKDENPNETAHRELLEELGFDVELKFIAKRLLHYDNETHFAYCYIGKYNGSEIIIQKDEVEQVKFVDQVEFEKLFVEENDNAVIEENKWIQKMWEENVK